VQTPVLLTSLTWRRGEPPPPGGAQWPTPSHNKYPTPTSKSSSSCLQILSVSLTQMPVSPLLCVLNHPGVLLNHLARDITTWCVGSGQKLTEQDGMVKGLSSTQDVAAQVVALALSSRAQTHYLSLSAIQHHVAGRQQTACGTAVTHQRLGGVILPPGAACWPAGQTGQRPMPYAAAACSSAR
jgi:hypothetical protein